MGPGYKASQQGKFTFPGTTLKKSDQRCERAEHRTLAYTQQRTY